MGLSPGFGRFARSVHGSGGAGFYLDLEEPDLGLIAGFARESTRGRFCLLQRGGAREARAVASARVPSTSELNRASMR